MDLRSHIRDIPDFPKPGITFFDITPLLAHPVALQYTIDTLVERFSDVKVDKIAAADARGFIFGAPVALKMGVPFIPVRKPGKLPYETTCVTYDLEYGTDTLCMHTDAVAAGENVLVIDDLLATGGTMLGMLQLIEKAGGNISGVGVVIELSFLDGIAKLKNYNYKSLLTL